MDESDVGTLGLRPEEVQQALAGLFRPWKARVASYRLSPGRPRCPATPQRREAVLLIDWDEQQAARADGDQAICAAGELGSLLGHEVGLCMGLWLSVPSGGIEYVPMLSAGAQRCSS